MNEIINVPQTTKCDVKVVEESWDIFSGRLPVDPIEVKKHQLAVALTALIAHSGKTKSQVAEETGIHKSAISRLLSGSSNAQLKSIWAISSNLGYDFDVIFHSIKEPSPKQPWHIHVKNDIKPREIPTNAIDVEAKTLLIQTREQVANDLLNKRGAEFYCSVSSTSNNLPTINIPSLGHQPAYVGNMPTSFLNIYEMEKT